jgi:hypothetical protein
MDTVNTCGVHDDEYWTPEGKGKGNFHPKSAMKAQIGSRGTTLLFL